MEKFKSNVLKVLNKKVYSADLVQNSRHAAAICLGHKILCTGVNQRKTHPLMKQFQDHPEKLYLHAEINAIVQVINKYGTEILPETEIYVTRLSKGGNIGSSKPCESCQKAIDFFKIKRVHYWTDGNESNSRVRSRAISVP